jgi:hypothetical protein
MKDQVLPSDKEVIFGLPKQYFHGCSITELRNFVGNAEALIPARREDLPSGQLTITQFFRTQVRVETLETPDTA